MKILFVIPNNYLQAYEGEVNVKDGTCDMRAFVIDPGTFYITAKGVYYYNEIPSEPIVSIMPLEKTYAIPLSKIIRIRTEGELHHILYEMDERY